MEEKQVYILTPRKTLDNTIEALSVVTDAIESGTHRIEAIKGILLGLQDVLKSELKTGQMLAEKESEPAP